MTQKEQFEKAMQDLMILKGRVDMVVQRTRDHIDRLELENLRLWANLDATKTDIASLRQAQHKAGVYER